MKKKALNNPLAIATVASNPDVVKKVTDTAANVAVGSVKQAKIFIQWSLAIAGIGVGLYFANKAYKNYRKRAYLEANLDNADVQAAIIIHNSIKKLEVPGFMSLLLPDINVFTDENSIYSVAQQTTSLGEVQRAYRYLFDEILADELTNAFNTEEYKTFFNLIKAKGGPSVDPTTGTYPIYLEGETLYSALKNKTLSVKKAVFDESTGKWKSTNELFGTFNLNQEIGKVIKSYKYATTDGSESRYYIVSDKSSIDLFDWFGNNGLVWDNQVTNVKL